MRSSDESIAARIRRGDSRAFDEFFDLYAGPLLGYLAGMVGGPTAAEDLFQETMLRVYRHIDGYQEQGNFRAWVFRIATNLALTELRRRTYDADQRLDEEALAVPDPHALDPQGLVEAEERERMLEAGLARLADEQRAVILLRVRQGLGIREIASVLDVPEGTVKSRIHYAVRKLRTFIDSRDGVRVEDEVHDELR